MWVCTSQQLCVLHWVPLSGWSCGAHATIVGNFHMPCTHKLKQLETSVSFQHGFPSPFWCWGLFATLIQSYEGLMLKIFVVEFHGVFFSGSFQEGVRGEAWETAEFCRKRGFFERYPAKDCESWRSLERIAGWAEMHGNGVKCCCCCCCCCRCQLSVVVSCYKLFVLIFLIILLFVVCCLLWLWLLSFVVSSYELFVFFVLIRFVVCSSSQEPLTWGAPDPSMVRTTNYQQEVFQGGGTEHQGEGARKKSIGHSDWKKTLVGLVGLKKRGREKVHSEVNWQFMGGKLIKQYFLTMWRRISETRAGYFLLPC